MQSVKIKGVGTNPKVFDTGVTLAQMWPKFYYQTPAGWSEPFPTAQDAYDAAWSIEEAKKKLEKLKKK